MQELVLSIFYTTNLRLARLMLANNRSTALPVGITNALQPSKPNFLQVGTTYAIKPCNYPSQANLWFAGTTKTFCRCKTRHFAGSLVAGAIRPSKPIGLPVPKHYNTLGLTKTLCKIRRLAGTLRPCNPLDCTKTLGWHKDSLQVLLAWLRLFAPSLLSVADWHFSRVSSCHWQALMGDMCITLS